MRKYLLILIPILTGCFKDEPKLPQYYATQEIDVAVDSFICYSSQEDFDHFLLSCSEPFDSVHWYYNFLNPVFLGSGQPLELPNDPYNFYTIKCLGFSGLDTTEFVLELSYCGRYIYIPVAFTPDQNGVNNFWSPTINMTDYGPNAIPYTVHWEIRTVDGGLIFQSDNAADSWDGSYNGSQMPAGIYFYYIDLVVEGEQRVEYTGWLNLIR